MDWTVSVISAFFPSSSSVIEGDSLSESESGEFKYELIGNLCTTMVQMEIIVQMTHQQTINNAMLSEAVICASLCVLKTTNRCMKTLLYEVFQ